VTRVTLFVTCAILNCTVFKGDEPERQFIEDFDESDEDEDIEEQTGFVDYRSSDEESSENEIEEQQVDEDESGDDSEGDQVADEEKPGSSKQVTNLDGFKIMIKSF
jgi:hypothetical protein